MGTTVSQMPSANNRIIGGQRGPNGVHVSENMGSSTRQGLYGDGPSNGDWQGQQQDHVENAHENPFSSGRRLGDIPIYGGQSNVTHGNSIPYDREDQIVDAEAAAIAHQEEQRGVSHLSNAVTVVTTNGVQNRQSQIQAAPNGHRGNSLGSAVMGVQAAGLSLAPGVQLAAEKRGPVEFNHAIGYVNKIKVRAIKTWKRNLILT